MKLLSASLILAGAICAPVSAHAAGWWGIENQNQVSGWACNPQLPNVSGWIHLWRSDDKFLGALYAGNHREQAVGDICGDSGYHGFSGTLSYPPEYLDNKEYTVRAFFINPHNTVFELQNSVQLVFIAPPPPTMKACSPVSQAGWVVTAFGRQSYASCSSSNFYAAEWTYTNISNMPVGSIVNVCDTSYIPNGWALVSNKGTTSTSCYVADGLIYRWGWEYAIRRNN